MGWFWSSTPETPRPAQPPAASQSAPASPPQSTPTPPQPSPTSKAAAKDADSELNQFLADLQAGIKTDPPSRTPPTGPQPPPSSSIASTISSWIPSLAARTAAPAEPAAAAAPLPTSTSRNPTPASDALAHSLRPTTMSCRQAFDLAYACQSIGGQFTAVYRDGGMRSCSHLWDDFWFCMRTKSYSGPVVEEMVREHYRKRELEKYGGRPNSEDVWSSREEMVEPGTAFREPLVEEVVSDEEWQLMEIARRQQIRAELGIE